MRIGHCQFETWCTELEHTLSRVEEGLASADEAAVEIVPSPQAIHGHHAWETTLAGLRC